MCLNCLARLIERRFQLARFTAKVVSRLGSFCQVGVELRLTFGKERASDRHHGTMRLLDAGQILFEALALHNFLFELCLKLRLTLGSSRLSRQPFPGAGVVQRVRRVGQLSLEGASRRRSFGELSAELGFAL